MDLGKAYLVIILGGGERQKSVVDLLMAGHHFEATKLEWSRDLADGSSQEVPATRRPSIAISPYEAFRLLPEGHEVTRSMWAQAELDAINRVLEAMKQGIPFIVLYGDFLVSLPLRATETVRKASTVYPWASVRGYEVLIMNGSELSESGDDVMLQNFWREVEESNKDEQALGRLPAGNMQAFFGRNGVEGTPVYHRRAPQGTGEPASEDRLKDTSDVMQDATIVRVTLQRPYREWVQTDKLATIRHADHLISRASPEARLVLSNIIVACRKRVERDESGTVLLLIETILNGRHKPDSEAMIRVRDVVSLLNSRTGGNENMLKIEIEQRGGTSE